MGAGMCLSQLLLCISLKCGICDEKCGAFKTQFKGSRDEAHGLFGENASFLGDRGDMIGGFRWVLSLRLGEWHDPRGHRLLCSLE